MLRHAHDRAYHGHDGRTSTAAQAREVGHSHECGDERYGERHGRPRQEIHVAVPRNLERAEGERGRHEDAHRVAQGAREQAHRHPGCIYKTGEGSAQQRYEAAGGRRPGEAHHGARVSRIGGPIFHKTLAGPIDDEPKQPHDAAAKRMRTSAPMAGPAFAAMVVGASVSMRATPGPHTGGEQSLYMLFTIAGGWTRLDWQHLFG